MKKTNRIFFTVCMAGAFAVMFGSCKKNDETANSSIGLPQFEEEVDARAYIDINNSNKLTWKNGDQVVIYNLDAQDGTNSEKAVYSTTADGKTSGTFTYESGDQLSAKKYGYFVFYPAAKVNVQAPLDEMNYETFTVEDTQVYTTFGNSGTPTVDSKGLALAIDINSLSGNYSLKHIFGILRLKLKGTGNVNKIEVIDERFNLHGSVSMKLHEVKMDKFTTAQNYFIAVDDPYNNSTFVNYWNEFKSDLDYTTQGGGKKMTLSVPSVALNTNTETHFFIGLRPGALKYGFTVKVYLDGQDEPEILDYTGNNNLHYGIKAGIIKGLSATIN